jgi:hypothetical protein
LPGQAIWKLQNLDNKHWFGSVESYPNQPMSMIKSVDSGLTWSQYIVDSSSGFNQVIGFVNKMKGWTGGNGSTLFETSDGGQTWAFTTSCNRSFDRFQRVNDTLAYMTGKSFMRYSKRPLVVGVNNKYLDMPFHKLEIKPNPVKMGSHLYITIEQTSDTYAELGIVDMQGKFIEVIQKKIQPKGIYSYQINIDEKYSAGMYTIYLYTNEGMESLNFSVR